MSSVRALLFSALGSFLLAVVAWILGVESGKLWSLRRVRSLHDLVFPLLIRDGHTGSMIAVAPLQPDDRGTWERLFAGYNAFYDRTWPAERYEQAWQAFRSAERIHALGGRLDGRLVGIAHFLVHPSTTSSDLCYLQDLFTDPDARGRGVGRSLIEAVSAWAREQGCGRLYWHTQRHNDAARRLYDQLGEHRDFILYIRPL